MTNRLEKYLEGTFKIELPENIPSTYNYDDVDRRILFEVCVVDLLADFSVTKPLIHGNMKMMVLLF